jgi:hypothetical protein
MGAVPGTNGIRIGRIALATIAGEVTPIVLLVGSYSSTKPGVNPQTRQAFGERVGMCSVPIAGAIATFGFGFSGRPGSETREKATVSVLVPI